MREDLGMEVEGVGEPRTHLLMGAQRIWSTLKNECLRISFFGEGAFVNGIGLKGKI